jgi:hypothetical protein
VKDCSSGWGELKITGWFKAGVEMPGRYANFFRLALAIGSFAGRLVGNEFGDLIATAYQAANAFWPSHLFEVSNALLSGSELRFDIYDRRRVPRASVCAKSSMFVECIITKSFTTAPHGGDGSGV